ncbi:orotidine 5'-phosphate decarboxylase / HUMPS family protein [Glycomyces sp. NPDC048151]|uniref:orotidine 5'-phosphate decarboxylase / HUMPS family protein n=1 Tax=Glycomyces sp. NPDC048151 TaxID=3364002 RepID=UPI00371042F9
MNNAYANNRLRRLREQTRSEEAPAQSMSRIELAGAVNAWVQARRGRECDLDANYIGKLERGNIRWPQKDYRDALRAILGVDTNEELGFQPPQRQVLPAVSEEEQQREFTPVNSSGARPFPSWGESSRGRTAHLMKQLRQHHARHYHRPEPAVAAFDRFLASADRALLVTGPAGTGKTSLTLHLAERHHTETVIQLHNGSEWDSSTDLAREILRYDSRSCGDDSLLSLEHALFNAGATTVIVIDGLDTPERLDTAARGCDTLIRYIYDHRLRFVLCFRTPPIPDLSRFPLLQTNLHTVGTESGILLDRWTEADARRIWSEHANPHEPDWDRLPPLMRRMARTPLLMRMIKTQLPQGQAREGNTYTFIEQWLNSRHLNEPVIIEHDVLDDFEQARRHLTELQVLREPGRAIQKLNALATTSLTDARSRVALALTLAGLAFHQPELLSSAALTPGCDPETTLPMILEIAAEHDLELNREVIRTAAGQALQADRVRLASALLGYHRPGLSEAEQAQWICDALNRYGSQLWPAINQFVAESAGPVATALLTKLNLSNPSHAIYMARYLGESTPLGEHVISELQTHPDWRVRAALAEAAADHLSTNTTSLTALAHDPDYKVRSRLAAAVARTSGGLAESITETLLSDPNWHVRTTLVQAVAHEADPRLDAIILSHCQGPEWRRRPPAAAKALGEITARGAADSNQHVLATEPRSDRRIDRSGYRRLRVRRSLQIALDLYDLERAREVASAVAKAGVDLIEVGDPLIKTNGVAAIEAIRQSAPESLIIAEMMSADWGRDQVELAAKAGADAVLLIGPASFASMDQAVTAARKYDLPVTIDIPDAHRNREWIQQAEHIGIDGFTITTNIDLGIAGPTPLEQAKQVRSLTQRPIAVSGGFSLSDPELVLRGGWDILIVGRAVVDAVDPAQAARQLLDLIDQPATPERRHNGADDTP